MPMLPCDAMRTVTFSVDDGLVFQDKIVVVEWLCRPLRLWLTLFTSWLGQEEPQLVSSFSTSSRTQTGVPVMKLALTLSALPSPSSSCTVLVLHGANHYLSDFSTGMEVPFRASSRCP